MKRAEVNLLLFFLIFFAFSFCRVFFAICLMGVFLFFIGILIILFALSRRSMSIFIVLSFIAVARRMILLLLAWSFAISLPFIFRTAFFNFFFRFLLRLVFFFRLRFRFFFRHNFRLWYWFWYWFWFWFWLSFLLRFSFRLWIYFLLFLFGKNVLRLSGRFFRLIILLRIFLMFLYFSFLLYCRGSCLFCIWLFLIF